MSAKRRVDLKVGGRIGGKRLGDCDHEDLKVQVRNFRALAARHASLADRYQQLLAAMEAHQVDTVDALPTDVIDSVLGDAA